MNIRESKSHKISTPFLWFEICDYFEDCFFLYGGYPWWKYLCCPKCAPNVICKSGSLFNLLIYVFCYNIFFYLAVRKKETISSENFSRIPYQTTCREIFMFANIFSSPFDHFVSHKTYICWWIRLRWFPFHDLGYCLSHQVYT